VVDGSQERIVGDRLDEVLVSVTPVLPGDGNRLFEQSGGRTVRLDWTPIPR
jgi:hypothetical protein